MKTILLFFITLWNVTVIFSQNEIIGEELSIPSKKMDVKGTFLIPQNFSKGKIVILIPGSGPTDRNGNQPGFTNNSLKLLAEALYKNNIASFRYDKSVLHSIKNKDFKEEDISFNDFIDDAVSVVKYFKNDERFSSIIIAGHSQGSLVGMIAATGADAFISLAGAGRSIDLVFQEQLLNQAPALKDDIAKTLDSLRVGKIDKNYNKLLSAIFRESVQPFLISWIKHNPQVEIQKLTIPVLIVNGTKDIQVKVEDAELLHKNAKFSKLVIVENMNHVLKEIDGGINENMSSYNKPELPLSTQLVDEMIAFILSIK
ncbi:MAG: alpha/beta hydrolase [Flavobacteriaceae bacterium]